MILVAFGVEDTIYRRRNKLMALGGVHITGAIAVEAATKQFNSRAKASALNIDTYAFAI